MSATILAMLPDQPATIVGGLKDRDATWHDAWTIDLASGLARVTLNRPERLNALTDATRERISTAFAELGRDDSVRVVILDAVGRGFCASGDASNMGRFAAVSDRDRLKSAHRMIVAIANIEKPVIAAVRGPVAGIGWSMAVACDMIVASDTAVFSQVFRNVGLVPDGGAIYFLTQMLGVLRAKELVSTGRKMPAEEALQLGLVTKLVADDRLDAATRDLAGELARGPGFAFGVAKKMFKSMNTPTLETCLDAETWAQGVALMTEDHSEGVQAFMEKRKPDFVRAERAECQVAITLIARPPWTWLWVSSARQAAPKSSPISRR